VTVAVDGVDTDDRRVDHDDSDVDVHYYYCNYGGYPPVVDAHCAVALPSPPFFFEWRGQSNELANCTDDNRPIGLVECSCRLVLLL
jgi:hypothetical protein